MKEKIEFYIVKFFIWLVGLLPKKFIYKILKIIGKLFFQFEKRRSSLTIKNLTAAFPKKSEEEILKIARNSYKNIAITLAEIVLMFNHKIELDDMVTGKKEFLEKMELYTKDAKNGVVIITAHFSNWELAAQYLPKNGYPMIAIGRKGNNELIEKYLTTPFRQRFGNKNIYKNKAMINIIKGLKENKIIGLLIDQKSGGTSSVKVNFFGMPADTINSIAVLKLKYNPVILPIFFPRDKKGKYRPILVEPVEYIAQEEDDKEKKIEKMTQRYNDIFEEVIRQYPEQWFWMHNRWRLV
jgi:KDO2-lipid IV(A) lauroyltransferase